MSGTLTHHTASGDRWDLLADHYYGNPTLLAPLLRANPQSAHIPILPEGLTLTIPVLEEAETDSDASDHSPWRDL